MCGNGSVYDSSPTITHNYGGARRATGGSGLGVSLSTTYKPARDEGLVEMRYVAAMRTMVFIFRRTPGPTELIYGRLTYMKPGMQGMHEKMTYPFKVELIHL